MPKTKPPERRQANLSFEQMKAAIPKIDRRLAELEALLQTDITELGDSRVSALENKLDTLLTDTFGAATVEYDRYRMELTSLHPSYGSGMPMREIADAYKKHLQSAKAQLEAIKSLFQENLADAGETVAGRTLKAYEGLELDPAIERAVGELFRDGHYSNAVEDAVKALNSLVKLNSGMDDKDGSALMEFVFSPNKPVLKFNDLQDAADRDEQKGFMMLFSGAVAGLRNPRAHKLMKDDPERALEFIAFISLLAKLAGEAKKV
ncbi:MAG: TIGR02391 family protein [Terriglobia bacterium]